MSADWDVESYRTEFESEEHWELRKNFMLAHKDKLTEDEIVCLAQVFTNIELLGCRYPEGTMRRVAELAKGLVESFREKKKNCLKRTFVAASDAASLKVKRGLRKPFEQNLNPKYATKRSNLKTKNINSTSLYSDTIYNNVDTHMDISHCCQFNNDTLQTEMNSDIGLSQPRVGILPRPAVLCDSKVLSGSFSQLVLFICDGEHPVNSLERNAALNKCKISWTFNSSDRNSSVCSIYIDDRLVATGEGKSNKISREKAARAAIEKLQSSCYTVKIKAHFVSGNTINPYTLECSEIREKPIKDEVGAQIMKLMGWTGGGLGVKEQGSVELVSLLSNTGRSGLGLRAGNIEDREFRSRARTFIKKWMNSDSAEDLVFSSDFSIEQRKILHGLAIGFSLKSKSYGKGEERHLVISKKPSPWKIVQDLLNSGGTTSKYELIIPNIS